MESIKKLFSIFPGGKQNKKRKISYGISATKLRNYFINDPILDWLKLYGEQKGYKKDLSENSYFEFNMNRGNDFEKIIIESMKNQYFTFINVGENYSEFCQEGIDDTINHMKEGKHIIYQGYLADENLQIYGIPDLLIRSDVLAQLFDNIPPIIQPTSKDFSWSYFAVDIKCSTIKIGKTNKILSKRPYKAQLFIYNQILDNLFFIESQTKSFSQPMAFILARRVCTTNGTFSGQKILGEINFNEELYGEEVDKALEWVTNVIECGSNWDIENPHRNELKPNMKNRNDYPWHQAKIEIAKKQKDLTQIWHVSSSIRNQVNTYGDEITEYFSDDNKKIIISKMVDFNKNNDYSLLNLSKLNDKNLLNFYVDFEYINGCDLSFNHDTRTHLYMIGIGYIENNNWKYEVFIPESLTVRDEKLNIQKWLFFMKNTIKRLNYENYQCIHWTNAEPALFSKLKNEWKIRNIINWIDLQPILKNGHIVFDDMYNFSLKTVVRAMNKKGYIDTIWEDNIVDGLGANMVIIRGYQTKKKLTEYAGISDIIAYNEVDCKSMYQIYNFLSSVKKNNI